MYFINKMKIIAVLISIIFLISFNDTSIAKTHEVDNLFSIDIPEKWMTITSENRQAMLNSAHKFLDSINETEFFHMIEEIAKNKYSLFCSISNPYGILIHIYRLPLDDNNQFKLLINNFNELKNTLDKSTYEELYQTYKKLGIKIVKYIPQSIIPIDGIKSLFGAIILRYKNNDEKIIIDYTVPLEHITLGINFVCKNNKNNLIMINSIKKAIRWLKK